MSMKKILFAGLYLSSFITLSAHAAIEGIEFKAKTGSDKQLNLSDAAFINPDGSITVVISAGLDRKVSVELLKEAIVVASSTSDLIDINSRIAFNGKEFYGKKITLPPTSDGLYTLKVNLLTASGDVIDTWRSSTQIDSIAPASSSSFSYSYSGHASGSIDVFGSYNLQEFSVSGLADNANGSGINKVEFIAQPNDGSGPLLTTSAVYDHQSKKALISSFPGALFPVSRIRYKVGFRVFDNAGNFTDMTRVSSIDKESYSVRISHVWNPVVSNWEPYVNGMTVYENPTKYRVERLASDFVSYNGTEYGWTSAGTERVGDYVYNEVSITTPASATYWVYLTSGGYVRTIQSNTPVVVLAPDIDLAPQAKGPTIEWKNSDGNWSDSSVYRSNKVFTITEVRVHSQPRNYEQIATLSGKGTCIIPANATSCEMSVNIPFSSGRSYVPYTLYYASSANGVANGRFNSHMGYLFTYWDFNPSQIKLIDISNTKIAVSVLDQDRTNNWQAPMWLTNGFYLDSTSSGVTKRISASKAITTDYNRYQAEFDLSNLQSGLLNVDVVIIDSYGNEVRERALTNYINDTSPPEIIFLSEDKVITDGQTIVGLESVIVDVNDMSDVYVKSATLMGGPTSDNVLLATRSVASKKFGLEYPRIFPSLEENESYSLKVIIHDKFENITEKVLNFKYIPPNLIKLNKVNTMAVNKPIYSNTDSPIAVIKTDTLRTQEGHIASGDQEAYITLRSDAAFPIKIRGVTISPGETKKINIMVDQNGMIREPVYPGVSGIIGSASFLVDIPQVTSMYGA
jgi:hypothetical protein